MKSKQKINYDWKVYAKSVRIRFLSKFAENCLILA